MFLCFRNVYDYHQVEESWIIRFPEDIPGEQSQMQTPESSQITCGSLRDWFKVFYGWIISFPKMAFKYCASKVSWSYYSEIYNNYITVKIFKIILLDCKNTFI